jgi:hypothetical protein
MADQAKIARLAFRLARENFAAIAPIEPDAKFADMYSATLQFYRKLAESPGGVEAHEAWLDRDIRSGPKSKDRRGMGAGDAQVLRLTASSTT